MQLGVGDGIGVAQNVKRGDNPVEALPQLHVLRRVFGNSQCPRTRKGELGLPGLPIHPEVDGESPVPVGAVLPEADDEGGPLVWVEREAD